jgi:hypothetical protein
LFETKFRLAKIKCKANQISKNIILPRSAREKEGVVILPLKKWKEIIPPTLFKLSEFLASLISIIFKIK